MATIASLTLAGALLASGPLGAKTVVHLLQHTPDSAKARVMTVPLTAGAAPGPGTVTPFDALPQPHATGRFYVAAAADGERLAWARPVAGRTVVHWRVRSPGEDGTVALPEPPAALHLHGDALYVGLPARVGYVDLAAEKPTFADVHRREALRGKAYDLFLRAGDRLVAVDDVVQPYFADLFRLGERGRPEHLADWRLPGIINGRYDLGAFHRTAATDEGTVVLVASYGIMSGSGHDLVALPIRDGKLPVSGEFILNGGGAGDGAVVLEEHAPRGRTRPPTTLAGDEVTAWTGLALASRAGASPDVLLAAGSRGVLAVSLPLARGAKAVAVKTGGVCHDVTTVDGHVLALVEEKSEGKGALVVLRRGESGWAVAARHDLPEVFHRFVD